MKHLSKALSLLLVVLIISTALVGCSTNEMSVFNALIKSQSITSMESKTDITLQLDISGLSEKDMQQAKMVVQALNNAQLSLDQKVVQNTDKGIVKAQVDGKINAGGMALDMGFWVDTDMSGEAPVIKEIIKLPPIAMMALPPEVGSKEYIVIDAAETMPDVPGANLDFKKAMDASKQFQTKTVDFFESYANQFNPNFNIIKSSGAKVVNGVSLPVYQLKLDDATLKSLIRYMVNDFSKNEETFNLVKDFVVSLMQVAETVDPQSAGATEEVEKSFADMQESLPEFTENFNAFMDSLKDVKLLGGNGISIDYAINSKGYIVNESGVIDLEIDIKAIADAISKITGEKTDSEVPNAVIKLGLTFNTDISKINENVEIKFPELTDENSINLMDIMPSVPSIPYPDDTEDGVKIYINGNKVIFNNKPVIRNGRTLAPAREVFESLDGEVLWNPDTQTATSVVGDSVIEFTIGSSEAVINGISYKLDEAADLIDDRSYVPVRFLAESLGGEVYWDDATSTAIITTKK